MIEQASLPGFDDGKAPDALRTIGEVAKALGIRQHVLRYWEEQFPMLKPLKRSGGRRYYRPEDVRLLATIDRLVDKEGYTLRGARLAIEGSGDAKAPAAPMAPPPADQAAATADDIAPRLRAIRDTLAQALAVA
ncbi:MAG: MerR family transcriptional regulator [Novosphingobium sp.]|nr:MerR family transcriptional regulator [Novosphingobium sp.]